MRTAVLLALLLLPAPLRAWDETDHVAMTRIALQEVANGWGLNQSVDIHPLQSLLDKLAGIRPELGNTWHWADYLRIHPRTNFDFLPPQLAGSKTISPSDLISLASVDPDDGRDQDLFVRDERGNLRYAYPDQKWFGAMHGPNSQAFRHLEKPAFDWRHPLATFGFPFRSVGEATLRSEIYFEASLLAFSLGEDYWGWRLLGGSLHYIEDLHQPYHAGQVTPGFVLRGLWAYLRWGREDNGFLGTFSHLVANSHHFFESYVALRGGPNEVAKKEAFAGVNGTDILPSTTSVRELAIQVRDASNLVFPELITAVGRAADPILFSSYTFLSDGDQADDPLKFLNRGPSFEEANRQIFEITKDRFGSAGRVIRTVVHESIQRKGRKRPEEILKGLDALLK